MALNRWIPRKSFDEAMEKAEKLRNAAQEKERRNSGLFTQAQENLRRELGLHDRIKSEVEKLNLCPTCQRNQIQMRPSRSMVRVRITRK